MDGNKLKLTLDQPVTYKIRVPGHLHREVFDADGTILVFHGFDGHGQPISDLTITVDQAALHGVLRRLYSVGIPLISVRCLNIGTDYV